MKRVRALPPAGVKDYGTCPKGHVLPHVNPRGQECTPLFCSDASKMQTDVGNGIPTSISSTQLDVPKKSRHRKGAMLPSADDDQHYLVKAQAMAMARQASVGGVPALQGGDAEEFHDRSMVDLLPAAAREVKYQLLYGNSAERRWAAERVQDTTGHGAKQAGGGVSALIILNGVNMDEPKPWAKRPSEAVVDAASKMAEPAINDAESTDAQEQG